jgi:hypothetical protein
MLATPLLLCFRQLGSRWPTPATRTPAFQGGHMTSGKGASLQVSVVGSGAGVRMRCCRLHGGTSAIATKGLRKQQLVVELPDSTPCQTLAMDTSAVRSAASHLQCCTATHQRLCCWQHHTSMPVNVSSGHCFSPSTCPAPGKEACGCPDWFYTTYVLYYCRHTLQAAINRWRS